MKPVTIYSTQTCPFCHQAKRLLNERGIPYQEVDVTGDDAARERLVVKADGRRTVPQIFIGDVGIGGYSDLAQLDREGKLREMLA
ncbi:MAG TPA: glutaredoxin 3 [Myxococcaceae bacterium]|nr:glutaredoxin 3 [Myxococcaceae bacterium]